MSLPRRLAELAEADVFDSLAQPAFAFDRAWWIEWLPAQEEVLTSLPALLDRGSVRDYCDRQSRSASGVIATFIASQVWGFGERRGRGGYRVEEALASPDLVAALLCAADDLDAGNPLAAFEALCVVFKVPQVAMSFGTKYLFFADRQRRALILDRLVAGWLAEHAKLRLSLTRNPASYARWLGVANQWAQTLAVTPEEIELAIFTDSLPERSQWRLGSSARG